MRTDVKALQHRSYGIDGVHPERGPAKKIRQLFLRRRAFDVMGQGARWPGQEMLGSFSVNGIMHANIIRRAFTVHLMFHERAEWILHGRAIARALVQNFRGFKGWDAKKQLASGPPV